MKINLYTCSLFILFSIAANAQQDQVLGYLTRVPQSTYLNPSHSPDFKWYIGMPTLSSFYAGVSNNLLNLHNVFQQTPGDSVKINFKQLTDNLHKKNYLDVLLHEELLAFGFKVKKNYFNFSLTEKGQVYFNYPKDLIAFVLEGNGSENYLGKTAKISGIALNMLYYHELALGYSREMNSKIRFGGRAKLLIGVLNAQSKRTDFTIYTAPKDSLFDLTIQSSLLVNANLPISIDNEDVDTKGFLTTKRNNGVAIDLGVTYKINDEITVGASALDIGFIRWRYSPVTVKYTNDPASFTFSGLELNKVFGQDTSINNNYTSDLADSITNIFDITTIKGKPYSTWLPARLLVSGSYKLTKSDIFGATAMAEYGYKAFHPALSLSYTRKLGREFQTTVCYSIKNRNFANIGWGFALSSGPFQLYALTDNILGLIRYNKISMDNGNTIIPYPTNSKNLNVRFGINWVFGYLGKVKDRDKGESEVQGYVQAVKKNKKESKEAKVKTDNPEKSRKKDLNEDNTRNKVEKDMHEYKAAENEIKENKPESKPSKSEIEKDIQEYKAPKKTKKEVIIQDEEATKKVKEKKVKVKDDNKHD